MSKIGPKQEPVAWATLVSLAAAALGSYGLGITPELEAFLVAVVTIAAAWWARQRVTPVPKAEANARDAFDRGVEAGEASGIAATIAATVPRDKWGINREPAGDVAQEVPRERVSASESDETDE